MGTRDVELVHAIMQAFVADPWIDPARIRVAADDGRVTLDGRVATHAQRLAAVTVAAGVPGVTAVANDLTVDEIETQATRSTDAALLDDVTRAVHASTVAVTGLSVAVRHRVATVEGVVAGERDRAALARAVQQIPGIHFVDNRVTLSGDPAPAGLAELSPEDCLRLLAGERFGRLAVRDGDGVDVFPVDYVLHDDAVYFRSGPGVKLLRLTEAPEVAFEIDGFGGGEAWSVVVKGTARRLDDDAEIAASGIAEAPSAHPTEKLNYVRIRPREITGRRFRV